MFNIEPLKNDFHQAIQLHIDGKTKPLGALGKLEKLAYKLATICSHQHNEFQQRLSIKQPYMLVFAGEHGIADHGVSIAPSVVTCQMLDNFARGGAAINVFCRQFNWQLQVIDAGTQYQGSAGVIEQKLGEKTQPIHLQPAMTIAQVKDGFNKAKLLVENNIKSGCDLMAFGEMGIGNTSSAAAILSAISRQSAAETVGLGTGIDEQTLAKKITLVQQALDTHKVSTEDPIQLLACLGGFEIVQICGAMLAAAENKIPIIVDGFICTAAALVAQLINKNVVDYFIFSHQSDEGAHQQMLTLLNAEPLLQLDLRLGEGSGAALALPLVEAACAFYSDMASFAQANVENVVS